MITPSDDSTARWMGNLEWRHRPREDEGKGVSGTSPAWRPDVRTIEWALSIIDEEEVGRMVLEDLSRRGDDPGAPTLGEIAVESVLLPLVGLAQAAQAAPLPVEGGPGGSQ